MLPYLERSQRSIGDQQGVDVERIVIDGGSDDGTREYLARQQGVRWVSEPDRGMYDALNKGFEIATGDFIGQLNADEQYLPGTLAFVAGYLRDHPDVDVVFGDAILVKPDGSPIAYRKGYWPNRHLILASHLYVYTCTMFFRRSILDAGIRFDPAFKSIGDMKFVLDMMQKGFRVRHVRRYAAVFTLTGHNLSQVVVPADEVRRLEASKPRGFDRYAPVLNIARYAVKALSGAYFERMPLRYAIFPPEGEERVEYRLLRRSAGFPAP